MLYALVLKPFAILALIAGAITVPTPLPTGAPLMALGLALLVATSSTARRWLRSVRRRSNHLDRLIRIAEPRFGRRLGVALRRTRPIVPAAARRDRSTAPE
ncbi:hypothetical protein [Microbaculum marinisediminis]|uniref:Transmembrane protein (PGPGW) n=1 Tax=Microbaculum marinisediminis TaxID=2931392 RepID=A0AAW5QQA4_9HYPH|nr:hypothetical protein [Microbaculum sp. A6E488]MCT8970251.1 hypothetical protein [Microbaculum sp. A6E488]